MRKPASISLTVHSEFRASHSLEGFEVPHFHLWKLSFEFKSGLPLAEDRLIDLVYLKDKLALLIAPLEGRHLNDALGLSPTSENLACYFWNAFLISVPNAPLNSVTVTLCNLLGVPAGSARVEA